MSMHKYFKEVDNFFRGKTREIIRECIICGETDFTEHDDTSSCPICHCNNCGFVWQLYQPTQEILDSFYAKSKPVDMWADIKNTNAEDVRQCEKYAYPWAIIRKNKIKSVLDVGCGNGFFLNGVDSSVLRIGIEMGEESKKHCNFPVYDSKHQFEESLHGVKKFDLITLFGVLEHLKNPVTDIEYYKQCLAPGGKICIIVPNVESLIVDLIKDKCATFCPQHLWFFSIQTLTALMAKSGLDIDMYFTIESEIQPILKHLKGFDAYQRLGFDLTDKDITEEKILSGGKGYKICAFFRGNDGAAHSNNPS